MAKQLAIPVLVIAVGVGWLLNTLELLPRVDWIWTLGLGVLGVATLAAGGLNKVTAVIGPFLLIASLFSVMRQTGQLRLDVEVPCLVITFGILLTVAKIAPLPLPGWIIDDRKR